jgi:hypothetical protein
MTTPGEPPEASTPRLERAFHDAMVDLDHRAKREVSYPGSYFIQMASNLGGLAAAKQLLHAPDVAQGFTTLWERGRLDLTVEALIVEETRFRPLFTEEEVAIARERLGKYNYRPR